jgi:hypothetical protein
MSDESKWTKGERARIAAVKQEITDVENERDTSPGTAGAIMLENLKRDLLTLAARADANVSKRRKSRISRALTRDTYIGLGLTPVRGSVSGKLYWE